MIFVSKTGLSSWKTISVFPRCVHCRSLSSMNTASIGSDSENRSAFGRFWHMKLSSGQPYRC